jgi:uncharacterized damage-inducible protein DinB
MIATLVTALLLALAATAAAQSNPQSSGAAHLNDLVKANIIKAAEKMPEEHYPFKPTPEVRSFAQLVGHIADANFGLCSVASSEKPPAMGIEKSKTTKADLVKALQDSYAFCDRAHAEMTDARGTQMVKFSAGPAEARRPEEMSRLTVLHYKTAHANEHYGNIVTYMRLKGIVPPSSERGPGE